MYYHGYGDVKMKYNCVAMYTTRVHNLGTTSCIAISKCRRIYIANFAIFKFAVFCLTIYTCPKNPELSASTKLRDFLDRYCACPTISYFFLRSGVLTTACVCVCVCVCVRACECLCVCVSCVCVSCMCVLASVCSRMCVCITQMSSFSNFDIIVLNWGAYKCVCVCVCV